MSRIASIRLSDLVPLAWGSLRRNRLRSLLTVGAIAVGIAVMVYLVALGFGLENITIGNIKKSASLLSMTVGTASTELLPLNDASVAKMKAIPGVEKTLPRLTFKGEVALENQRAPVTMVGVDPEYLAANDATKLLIGRYYREEDTETMVVTTGFLKLFGLDTSKTPLVLFTLRFQDEEYADVSALTDITVSGVVESDSQAVYMPRLYLTKKVNNVLPPYEHVRVTVADANDIENVRNGLIANGFKVSAAVDTVQDINRVFAWIRGVMITLGLIAIFVATIGMFNTLTISLLERTREIGIMKALGVRKTDISRIFLTEAMMIGILGGVLGLGLAFLLQQLTYFVLSFLAVLAKGTVPSVFGNPYYLLIGAFFFAVGIALITGIYPARRAARLNPIDAIRHE